MKAVALNCALCNLCDSNNGDGTRFSNMNEAKIHARVHFGQVKMFEDGKIDEKQMFERCFPRSQRKVDRDVSYRIRRSLGDICRTLFGKHPKPSVIECNLCGSGINIVQHGKCLLTDPIINHACVHAGVKPFKCRRCEKTFRKRSNVWSRFEHAHGAKPTKQDFEVQTERFHDDISSSIKRCFSKCKGGAPSKVIHDKAREYIDSRSRQMTNASELALQRHSFFNRTVKQYMDSDGKLECRLCSKKIKAKRSTGSDGDGCFKIGSVILHAQHHLQKPLYRCKVCSEPFNTYPATFQHLRRTHSLGMEKNHECFADKYHSDILTIFAQCYQKDGFTD